MSGKGQDLIQAEEIESVKCFHQFPYISMMATTSIHFHSFISFVTFLNVNSLWEI